MIKYFKWNISSRKLKKVWGYLKYLHVFSINLVVSFAKVEIFITLLLPDKNDHNVPIFYL